MRTRLVTCADGTEVKLRSHYAGCYRMDLTDARFGQIILTGNEWRAQVREVVSGTIVTYAGNWPTLREAVAELVDYRNGETQPLIFRRASKSAHILEPKDRVIAK